MDYSPPRSSVHGVSQARILKWVCHFLLQEIVQTQRVNLLVLHWQEDSLPLSHQESLKKIYLDIKMKIVSFILPLFSCNFYSYSF